MRIFSILIAALVAAALYFLVIEREAVLNFAQVDDDPESETDSAAEGRHGSPGRAGGRHGLDRARG